MAGVPAFDEDTRCWTWVTDDGQQQVTLACASTAAAILLLRNAPSELC